MRVCILNSTYCVISFLLWAFRYLVNCSLDQWDLHKLDAGYTCSVLSENTPTITIKTDWEMDVNDMEGSFILCLMESNTISRSSVEMDYADTSDENSSGQGETTPKFEEPIIDQDQPTSKPEEPKKFRHSTPYMHPSHYAQRLSARNRSRRAGEDAEVLTRLFKNLSKLIFSWSTIID